MYLCTTALLSCLPHNHSLLCFCLPGHIELRSLHRIRGEGARCLLPTPPCHGRLMMDSPSCVPSWEKWPVRAIPPDSDHPSPDSGARKAQTAYRKRRRLIFLFIVLLLIWSNKSLELELEFLSPSCERPQMMVYEHKYIQVACTFLLRFISI